MTCAILFFWVLESGSPCGTFFHAFVSVQSRFFFFVCETPPLLFVLSCLWLYQRRRDFSSWFRAALHKGRQGRARLVLIFCGHLLRLHHCALLLTLQLLWGFLQLNIQGRTIKDKDMKHNKWQIKKRTGVNLPKEDEKQKWCSIASNPFIEGLSQEVRRIAPAAGSNVLFGQQTHWDPCIQQKIACQKKNTKTHCVYSLTCGKCEDEYVGETLRAIGVRAKEHSDAVSKRWPQKNQH